MRRQQLNHNAPWRPSLDGVFQDARHAFRALTRSPGFTAAAVATLAIGIGLNAAVFTVTNAVLFKGFRTITGNDRILYIGTQNNGRGCCVSYPDFEDWRARTQSFDGLGAVADLRISFNDDNGFAESYTATQVSANAFRLLGHAPVVGRDFTAADERPGAPPVAILSHGFWHRRYANDPSVIGLTVTINGIPTTIIGVMPPGFAFPQNQELWLPLVPTADLRRRESRTLWFAFGRLIEGATIESARADLATIGRQLASAYPATNEGWVPQPQTFGEFFVSRNVATTYGVMWGAVVVVLLIACANLANLMLARAIDRAREISVRVAIGAGRHRIVRQLLIESLMLSAAGALAGWWLAQAGVRAYEAVANPPTLTWSSGLLDYAMDGRVLAYIVAISAGTALAFGLVPALRVSRLDVTATLKDGNRGTTAAGGQRLSTALVVAEMALALVLLTGAGVMLRSFANMRSANLGVTADAVTFLINLPQATYPSAAARRSFYDRLETRIAAIAGVEAVAITNTLPTGGSIKVAFEIADGLPGDERTRPSVGTLTVSPGYFRSVGASVISGRDFNTGDGRPGMRVALVNHRFAMTHWPGELPIGKRLRLFNGTAPDEWLTVIGVVSNIVQDDVNRSRQEYDPLVYVPLRDRPARSMWVIARTQVPVRSLGASLRRELQALDADLPIWLGPFTLAERLAGQGRYWKAGSDAFMLLMSASVAILLASLGLYAVIAHSVRQRTHEIGIRMAMGGTATQILALVCRQAATQVAIGLLIGLAAALAVNRVLESSLVSVSAADPLTFILSSAVLIVAATLGCLIPARRALRVDPSTALRSD